MALLDETWNVALNFLHPNLKNHADAANFLFISLIDFQLDYFCSPYKPDVLADIMFRYMFH